MSDSNSLNNSDLLVILNTPSFDSLSKEHKKMVISSYGDNNRKGVLDRMFGDNTERIPVYITFILCMSLMLIATIFSLASYFTDKNVDLGLWSNIIPVITLALGYMFGKNNKKE